MPSRPTICNMRGGRENATAEGDKAEQQNAAPGEPHAALPPRRRKSMANAAHDEDGGEGAQSKRRHGEKSGKRSGGARCLGNEGIDQGTRQEAVEHPKGKRRSAAACRQQAAQGYGKRAAAEAARKAMKALQQAEELQRHADHEQPRNNREDSLGGVEGATHERDRHSLRRAYHLAQRAREPTQKAVGRQSTCVVEQVAQDGRSVPIRIAAERAGKAAAHADAMKAACKARSEEHKIVTHGRISCQTSRV